MNPYNFGWAGLKSFIWEKAFDFESEDFDTG